MTRRVAHALPSASGRDADIGRMLARLLGPAWQAGDGTVNAAQFLADGAALDAVTTTLETAAAQAFAGEATVTLEDWERVLYLPLDPLATNATRQTQVLARVRGTLSGSHEDMESSIRTLVPGATIRERTTADAVALGLPRAVFLLRVALGATFGDTDVTARVTALLNAAKPAHASFDFATYEYDEIITEAGEDLLAEDGDLIATEA